MLSCAEFQKMVHASCYKHWTRKDLLFLFLSMFVTQRWSTFFLSFFFFFLPPTAQICVSSWFGRNEESDLM